MTITLDTQTVVSVGETKASEGLKKLSGLSTRSWLSSMKWKILLTELISTLMLILFGCMSNIPLDGFSQQPPLYGPFGFGLMVLINVHTFAHISGAHMNPAVTLVAVLWGLMPIPLGLAYVVFQCIGAILGYGVLIAVCPIDPIPGAVCVTLPHLNHNAYQAIGVEVALTTALGLVNLAAWDPINKDKQDSMSLKFGFFIAGLSIVGGPLTGASMNPARSLGPALWTKTWEYHWIYWVGPLLGGALSVAVYWLISPWKSSDVTQENKDI